MDELQLSVVVPAFNEEKLLADSLAAIRHSVQAAGFGASQWELRVCDNASDDATAQLARDAGAVVVYEPQRQIARARNTGAAQARGQWLLFVDADTRPSVALMQQVARLMSDPHCCAAGAIIDGSQLPFAARALVGGWNTVSRHLRLACGAFVLCRAVAFRELGGFNTDLYAAEEIDLSRRLVRWGRDHGQHMIIIADPALHTSMRKLDLYSPWEMLAMMARAACHPMRALKSRRYLDHWYDGRR